MQEKIDLNYSFVKIALLFVISFLGQGKLVISDNRVRTAFNLLI